MNHMPAHMQDAFNRIFKPREWHSEAERQEVIGRIAKDNEKEIIRTLLTNNADAMAVADGMLDKIGIEDMSLILRCALSSDVKALQTTVLKFAMQSVSDVAEYRAIAYVEEKGPAVLDR